MYSVTSFKAASESLVNGRLIAVSANPIFFDDIIHILIPTAGEIDEHGALAHGLCQLHAVGNSVRAFDGRNDALHAGKLEESIDGLIIGHDIVLHSAKIVQEGVFGAAGGLVQAAGDGVDRGGVAVFVLQHDGIEAVHNAFLAVGQAGSVVAHLDTPA